MAVAIRLTRCGTKKKPFYRVIVTDSRKPRDGGKPLDYVGTHDPLLKEKQTKLDLEKIENWLSKGARPSSTVKNIIKEFRKANTAS